MSDEDSKGVEGQEGQPDDAGTSEDSIDLPTALKTLKDKEKSERQLRKEVGGLDTKVNELMEELKSEREQRKTLEKKNMPADRLREMMAQEQAEERSKQQQETAKLQTELARYQQKEERRKILNTKTMSAPLRRALSEDLPTDPDELNDFIDELIEQDVEERVLEGNKYRVGNKPQAGGNSRSGMGEEWKRNYNNMGINQRDKLAHEIPSEERKKLLKEQLSK